MFKKLTRVSCDVCFKCVTLEMGRFKAILAVIDLGWFINEGFLPKTVCPECDRLSHGRPL